jgi:hypothetical protein
MVLDGAMVLSTCIIMCVQHPGIGFDGKWTELSFKWRSSKDKKQGEPLDTPLQSHSEGSGGIEGEVHVTKAG